MKFSYPWLKQLVNINLPADKLAEFLSLHAFETEVVDSNQKFENIIVAKVTKIDKHPNADRLRIIELTDSKNKIGPVVCGAWNFEVGAIVALALPGAMIPHDQHDPQGKPFTLSKATIRGIESQGMICSAKELGISSDGLGIMLLDSNRKLGETFSVGASSSDTLLDISVPANRPDLLSYRGVAWEIAALTGKKYLAKQSKSKIANLKSGILKVRISEPNLCKKYLAVRLVNVKIGPSPKFIQERLKSSGLRPINNVVDITNYVMLEVGQPLHAFDASKVAGPINVRKAYVQESLTTLDGVKRKLTPDMLLIADSQKVLAVAGVMGSQDSGISEYTTELILEAANFNAVSIRRTARTLNLRTDASSRFEKSLPVMFANFAMEYACELLEKYASSSAIEFASAGGKPEKPIQIKLDPEKVNQLLGTSISATEQNKILEKLGFEVNSQQSKVIVIVPFWRPDITIWQDLAEEIIRFKGLDFLKHQPMFFPVSTGLTDKLADNADSVRDILVNLGYSEVYTYSFVSELDLIKWQIDKKMAVEIANPLSLDQQFMRPNLALNILKVVERNSNVSPEGNYFEIANVYWKEQGKVLERVYLFMISFDRTKLPSTKLTSSFAELSARLGIEYKIKQEEEQLAQIIIEGKTIGNIGRVDSVSELPWLGVSLDFEEFIKHIKLVQFKSIPRFPSKELDVALLVREDLSWMEVKNTVLAANQNLISEIRLLDVYEGKNITPGKKSLTFKIVYQAKNRTLTDEEVNKIHSGILDTLKSKLSAQIRD